MKAIEALVKGLFGIDDQPVTESVVTMAENVRVFDLMRRMFPQYDPEGDVTLHPLNLKKLHIESSRAPIFLVGRTADSLRCPMDLDHGDLLIKNSTKPGKEPTFLQFSIAGEMITASNLCGTNGDIHESYAVLYTGEDETSIVSVDKYPRSFTAPPSMCVVFADFSGLRGLFDTPVNAINVFGNGK